MIDFIYEFVYNLLPHGLDGDIKIQMPAHVFHKLAYELHQKQIYYRDPGPNSPPTTDIRLAAPNGYIIITPIRDESFDLFKEQKALYETELDHQEAF